ncbi:MAG: DNA mismatch repair endonuclease MutL [Lachnospiraceae bacterium]|nr:DNA mismatch repair endonuclease MutL [Lachnospiraceae bacterium]
MAKINVLDAGTIDKIAAGEVVERPASVAKELVENALDAGSTAVTVEIKEGGITFLRVTDNGSGIEASQVRQAFLRHATSKINSAEDLHTVKSLGFRGEALSSICAVAKVELITKTADSMTGIRYLSEGADEKEFSEVGAPDGTTIMVRNLFFNTPVRRKFLKQPQTEGSYIVDLMEHMALSRPDVSFKLIVNNQVKFHTSGNGELKEVIYRIYGRETAANLVEIQAEIPGIAVTGYLGKPILNRSNRNFENYYINGRYIKSNLLAKAIEDGYSQYLMQHKFPFVVLHFAIDTGLVDVNVHPTKMDVRFTEGKKIYDFVAGEVAQALSRREMIPEAVLEKEAPVRTTPDSKTVNSFAPEPFEKTHTAQFRVQEEMKYEAEKPKMQDTLQNNIWNRVKKPVVMAEKEDKMQDNPSILEKNPEITPVLPNNEKGLVPKTESTVVNTSVAEEEDIFFVEVEPEEKTPSEDVATQLAPKPMQLNLFEEKMLSEENKEQYQILGQIFDTYWLIAFKDKLFIIDQHAAHEKVKYERLVKQFKEKDIVSQSLNPPIVVTLSGKEAEVLAEYEEVFLNLGFEIEEFGGSEYALRSVPTDLYGCDEKTLFLEVLDELAEGGSSVKNLTVVEEKLASMACKAAVKGNNSLSVAEMETLIDELLTLDNPYNCPHGRPTIISMSKYEIEKKFKRIV